MILSETFEELELVDDQTILDSTYETKTSFTNETITRPNKASKLYWLVLFLWAPICCMLVLLAIPVGLLGGFPLSILLIQIGVYPYEKLFKKSLDS